jgi:hypothetical protein
MIKFIIQESRMDEVLTEEALKQAIDQYWETVPLVWSPALDCHGTF